MRNSATQKSVPTATRITTFWALFFCALPALAYHGNASAADAGAVDATATVAEDAAATTISLSTEVTGDDPEIYNAVTSGSGTVTITGAESISYAPAADFYGTEYITYDVRSTDSSTGAVTVDQAVVTVTVTSVNDAPTTVADSVTITEDASQTTINVASNDSDDDTLTADLALTAASVTSGDSSGTVSYSGGNVLYTPSADFTGTTVISYTVADTHATPATATGTLTVTVTAVNDAPTSTSTVSSPATYVATEDSSTDIDMSAYVSDPSDTGDSVVISSVTYTGTGSVSITGNDLIISYVPGDNFNGDDDIYFSATDNNGGTVSGLITVSVTSVTEAPVAVADAATVDEDSTSNLIDVKLNDTDDDDSYADLVISAPVVTSTTALGTTTTSGNVSVSGQKLSYVPATDFYGSETIDYTLTDTHGLNSTGTLTVTVSNTNDGPTGVADTATTSANTAVTIAVLANDTDVESDTLSISWVGPATNGITSISGTTIIYTPNQDFSGTDSFYYKTQDPANEESLQTLVTVTVSTANVGSCSSSVSTLGALANGCTVAPSAFRTSVYAFGLCTGAPTRPTASSAYDLSNCQLLYDGAGGSGTTVTFGATGTSYSFPSFTAPTYGSYTHGILLIGNSFEAKGILTLSGTNCVTTSVAPFIQCGANYTINDADYTSADGFDYFYASGTYSYTFSSDSVTADLIDGNNQLITTDGSGTQILAIQEFSGAQTVSEATRTIDIGFRVSQGLSINSSAASTAPFSIRFQVN